MSILEINDAPIPENDTAPGDGMLTCDKCGDHFEHTGRGRKPKQCPTCRETRTTKTPSTSRRAPKDVESAVAVLDGMYSTVALGLMMLSPNAASVWAAQLDTLQAQNRVTLAGDANLTKSINRLGERTGKAAFFLSHVFAVAPVVMVIRDEMPKRKPKPTPEPPTDPDYPAYIPAAPVDNMRFFGADA